MSSQSLTPSSFNKTHKHSFLFFCHKEKSFLSFHVLFFSYVLTQNIVLSFIFFRFVLIFSRKKSIHKRVVTIAALLFPLMLAANQKEITLQDKSCWQIHTKLRLTIFFRKRRNGCEKKDFVKTTCFDNVSIQSKPMRKQNKTRCLLKFIL